MAGRRVARAAMIWIVVGTITTALSTSAVATVAKRSPLESGAFVTALGKPVQLGSTVPANGDVNPYGIAIVRTSEGKLAAGSVLVSNFNDKANVQGTGTTLVELGPTGKPSVFAELSSLPAGKNCPGGIGLGTGLVILPDGYVVVGSVPAAGSSGAPANANPNGCLIVLDSSGKVVETWTNSKIDGPWDLTSVVQGKTATLFVSNVLNRRAGSAAVPKTGQCTVVRLNVSLAAKVPQLISSTTIGSSFSWEVNKPTFMLGPTGLALGSNGTLYVAQTLGNQLNAIPQAMTRSSPVTDSASVLTHGGFLNAPLGMVLAPNGDLVVTNGNDGNLVEVSPSGRQVAKTTLVKGGAGDLFGITLAANGKGIVFVNDGANAVDSATST